MTELTGGPRPLRVGLVGAGRIVELTHLPLLCSRQDVTVAGLFDTNVERAEQMAARFGAENVCATPEELFELDLDAALVACPNYKHAEVTVAALQAGINVLCEKPMATGADEARAMIDAADRNGRELMIAFANRFRPEVIALRKAIEDGALGEIRSVRCGWLRRSGVPGLNSWFTSKRKAAGGVLIDLGSHLVDLALWLTGNPRPLSVQCVTEYATGHASEASWYRPTDEPAADSCDVEIGATGFAVMEGPVNIFIEVSWDCAVPYDQTYLHLMGTRGSARIDTLFGLSPSGHRPAHPLRIWEGGSGKSREVAGSEDLLAPYRDQWSFFIDGLRNGRGLRASLSDSLATVELIEAMYQSASSLPPGAGAPPGGQGRL